MIKQYIGVRKCRGITKEVEKMNQYHCDISLQFVVTLMGFYHSQTERYITSVESDHK